MSKSLLRIYEKLILRHPIIAILAVMFIAIMMGLGLPNLKLDASLDSLTLENDNDLAYYRESIHRFGSSDFLVVTYKPDEGDLFDDNSLQTLKALCDDLRGIKGIGTVTSMLDVPLLYSPKVDVDDLLKPPRTLLLPDVDRDLVRQEFLESPVYQNLIMSQDAQTTIVLVEIAQDEKYQTLVKQRDTLRIKRDTQGLSPEEAVALQVVSQEFLDYRTVRAAEEQIRVAEIREKMSPYKDHAQIFLGGLSMITADMVDFIKSDLNVFGTVVLLFIIITLAIIFRQVRWVLLPLVTCILCVEIMLGYLGWVDWRMTIVSSNFVSLLLIITLALTIHLIVRYRELLRQSPNNEQFDLVRDTVKSMARPCFYTMLTTMVAFSSLVLSDIRPVIDFGWMMTVGLALSLIVAFIIIPAGMMIYGKGVSSDKQDDSSALTLGFSRFTEHHGGWVLGLALLASIVSAWGISQLKVENHFIDYFHADTEIYQGLSLIDNKLGGTIPLDIIINAPPKIDDGSISVEDLLAEEGEVEDKSKVDDAYEDPFAGMYADSDEGEVVDSEPEEDVVADPYGDPFAGMYADSDEGEAVDVAAEDNASVATDDPYGDPFAGMYSDSGEVDGETISGSAVVAEEEVEFIEDSYWFTRPGVEDIGKLHTYLEAMPEVGKVSSLVMVTDVYSELVNREISDFELALMSLAMSPENAKFLLWPYVNERENQARISLRIKDSLGDLDRNKLLEKIHSFAIDEAGFKEDQIHFTGPMVLYNNMLQSLFRSQILTMGTVFLCILVMFLVLFRSLSVALIAILPNLLAAGVVLGGMGIAGIPLDMMTITIAAITVGIGVDHDIHYITRFKHEFAIDHNYIASMHRAHASIGRALFYTAITIIVGFSILALSNFMPSVYFGLLAGLAMFSALLASMTLLPKLILMFKPFK
ncbi:MAG: MMPL family transporter [Porticoccus sp.]|nr:MMPL family transporter [Porticoccus sp.]